MASGPRHTSIPPEQAPITLPGRRLRPHTLEKVPGRLVQAFWYLPGISRIEFGFDRRGLRTKWREYRHRQRSRPVNLVILSGGKADPSIIDLTAYWINERCRAVRAVVDREIEAADAIWVLTQDPLGDDQQARLAADLAKASREAIVINPPEALGFYHRSDAFEQLQSHGINVPRYEFSEADIGQTRVVYKRAGTQGQPKTVEPYRGPVEGYRAFEFIDSSDAEGFYRRHRVFYVFGLVRLAHVFVSDQWNVYSKTKIANEYGTTLTDKETEDIRKVARVAGLEFFAVDIVRRNSDGVGFVTDINPFPSSTSTAKVPEFLGLSHEFDDLAYLGLPELSGVSVWEWMDDYFLKLINRGSTR